jgi:hypothetical protein
VEPMQPMKPMQPMDPMPTTPAWWPGDLGTPHTTGGQDGFKYAVFAEKRRVAVSRNGRVSVYDSGDHRISGVSQDQGGTARFSSQDGTIDLIELPAA